MRNIATVGALRLWLADYPDEMPVRVRGYEDHDYLGPAPHDCYVGEMQDDRGAILLVADQETAIDDIQEDRRYKMAEKAVREAQLKRLALAGFDAAAAVDAGVTAEELISRRTDEAVVASLPVGGEIAWETPDGATHSGVLEAVRHGTMLLVRLQNGDAIWCDRGPGRLNLRVVGT